ELGHGKTIDQAHHLTWYAARYASDRVAQGCQIRLVQTSRVDPLHTARDDGNASGSAEHERIELLTSLRLVLLGIVQRRESTQLTSRELLIVEQDRRRDQRTGQAAASRL